MKQARLIQVGLGGWGSSWAEGVLPQVARVRPVAFVDGAAAARERAAQDLAIDRAMLFPTLEAALQGVEADGVLVVLPTVAHKAVAEAALAAGQHVLVEKPFAASVAEASALVELAERSRRILMVSQNYRYHAATITAADLVARKTFGRPLSATIEFRQDWKATGHRYHDIVGPLLLDMGIHHFDMVRMIFGQGIARVACRSWTTPYSPFRDHGAAHALLELDSGLMVSYIGSWLRRGLPTPWGGQWVIECEQAELVFATRPAKEGVPPEAGKLFARRLDGSVEELPTAPIAATDRAGALDAFAEAILKGKPPPRAPTGRDNLGSLATSFACMRSSAEDGRWVALSEIR